jgi:putative ABC transport system permease protein
MWLLKQLSLPYLRRHRLRTILTIVSVSAGVSAVTATSLVSNSVLQSFEYAVAAASAGADLHLDGGGTPISDELIADVAGIKGVAMAGGVVEGALPLASTDATLMLLGVDLLGDNSSLQESAGSEVRIADELAFIASPDSVVLVDSLAGDLGLELGDSVSVIAPDGPRDLVLRGMLTPGRLTAAFGERLALMDLPAAQMLLGKDGLVDRIDVHVDDTTDAGVVAAAVEKAFGDTAILTQAKDRAGRAEDVLVSLRVVLTLVGAIALAISYFIIYHTVGVSIAQRRSDFGVLGAVGTSPWEILGWIITEAVALGAAATALGIAGGYVLATLSQGLFGAVTSSWVENTDASFHLSVTALLGAMALGFLVTLFAALAAARPLFSEPVLVLLGAKRGPERERPKRVTPEAVGVVLVLIGVALAVWAPRSLPYGPVVAFVLATSCSVLIGLALLSPAPARAIAAMAERVAQRSTGTALLVAAGNVLRRPRNSVAVNIAIVMALGATLANGSVISSFKNSYFSWFDQFYSIDVVVTAEGSATSILTARPFSAEVVDEIAQLPNVEEVRGIRRIGAVYDGRPVMLLAIDMGKNGLPLVDGSWSVVGPLVRRGDAYLVSDTLAYRTGLVPGDKISLLAASGHVELPVAGVFKDVYGGDLGAIALSRDHYAELWQDGTVDRIAVVGEGDPDAIQASINQALAAEFGVHAMSFRSSLDELRVLVDDAFRLSYGLIFICLAVSAIGIGNFLLAAVIDRRDTYRAMLAAGVPPRQIAGAVMGEGVIISLVGVVIGLLASIVVSAVIIYRCIPMLNGWLLDLHYPVLMAVLLAVSTVAIAVASGVLPGRMATAAGTAAGSRMD